MLESSIHVCVAFTCLQTVWVILKYACSSNQKTERLIIYLNKLNWFTEMYLPTLSNTQMLSYWDISHLWKLCTHSPFVMDDHAVKHRTNLTWHICIGAVRRNIGIASTRNIRSVFYLDVVWFGRWPEPLNFKTSHIRIIYSFPSHISAVFLLHKEEPVSERQMT
jgi:hypothetical protein